jgi:hypothetical protein
MEPISAAEVFPQHSFYTVNIVYRQCLVRVSVHTAYVLHAPLVLAQLYWGGILPYVLGSLYSTCHIVVCLQPLYMASFCIARRKTCENLAGSAVGVYDNDQLADTCLLTRNKYNLPLSFQVVDCIIEQAHLRRWASSDVDVDVHKAHVHLDEWGDAGA